MHLPHVGAALGCSRVNTSCLASEQCVPIPGCCERHPFPTAGTMPNLQPWLKQDISHHGQEMFSSRLPWG